MAQVKRTDYTNSAVNLCNPPELINLLKLLKRQRGGEALLSFELEQTALSINLKEKQKDIRETEQAIREGIDAYGSYQDLETGNYALKQRKLSVIYIASKVREFLRAYADTVIEEVVSKPKLEGLRRAKLVSQADLDRCAETTETFAFIIKTGEGG